MVSFSTAIKPLLPLLIPNWILGVGVFEYPIGKPRKALSLMYSGFWMAIYCIFAAVVYNIKYEYGANEAVFPIHFLICSQLFLSIITICSARHFHKVSLNFFVI